MPREQDVSVVNFRLMLAPTNALRVYHLTDSLSAC